MDNIVVKLTKDQLSEIPYPAVAHLNEYGGRFVLLHRLVDRQIYYTDPFIGLITTSVEEFLKIWTGVLLLMEGTAKSGEEGYEQKHKHEVFEQWTLYSSLFLLMISWVLSLFVITHYYLAIYILNSFGCLVSFLLVQKQFGLTNAVLNSFCKLGSKSDCDSVINSPASKLFGVVNLSEVGLWYFIGSTLSMNIAAFSLVSVAPFLFVFTLLAVALSIIAIYYQATVIKKWCPLCLAVVAVIWLQAILYLVSSPAMIFNFKSVSILIFGFSLPLIFWLSTRKRFIDSFQLPSLQRKLNRFLKSERVFQKLWEDQTVMGVGQFTHELQSGSLDAPVQLVVVSNPQCGPCAYTHAVLENLKNALNEKVNIVYRFTAATKDRTTVSYQMLETLFTIQQNESNERALAALSNWYQAGGNLERWKKSFSSPSQKHDDAVSEIIKVHEKWCAQVSIQKTPTLIINGKTIPEEFSVNDLKFQLHKMADKITEYESAF